MTFFRVLVVIFLLFFQEGHAQFTGLKKIRWEYEKVAPGLIWKSSHTVLNDTLKQNINLLIVNLKKREIALRYDPEGNIPVSRQAEAAGALAAVNGGFFNIKDGGSVTYIRTGGHIGDADTAKKWSRNANMTGALLIKTDNELLIEKAMPNSWYDSHNEYEDVLVTGPLLVSDGELAVLPETSFVITRHPRTAIGIKSRKKAVLITVDGRASEAAGMTLTELACLMMHLRCRSAVNLDGGGSTTMWISGKPFNGVVNMPSDNRKFDHEGERAVSDILIIR